MQQCAWWKVNQSGTNVTIPTTSFSRFFAQMTSCLVHYDVIYYPFPVNSHYLKMLGVDSPVTNNIDPDRKKGLSELNDEKMCISIFKKPL